MRNIIVTNAFKKDLKLARKRNLPEEKLNHIIQLLIADKEIPAANKDHALYGDFAGCRECHITPDWLLIYSKEDEAHIKILTLLRTGSHADLFG